MSDFYTHFIFGAFYVQIIFSFLLYHFQEVRCMYVSMFLTLCLHRSAVYKYAISLHLFVQYIQKQKNSPGSKDEQPVMKPVIAAIKINDWIAHLKKPILAIAIASLFVFINRIQSDFVCRCIGHNCHCDRNSPTFDFPIISKLIIYLFLE